MTTQWKPIYRTRVTYVDLETGEYLYKKQIKDKYNIIQKQKIKKYNGTRTVCTIEITIGCLRKLLLF